MRCVKQFDRVTALLSPVLGIFHRQVYAEPLEINHDYKHQIRGEKIENIREVLAIECFFQGANLIRPCDEEVEQGNDCSFELRASPCVDRSGGKGFPNDVFTDVRGDKQRD